MKSRSLNMRTAHGIYGTLQQYMDDADKDGYDDDIDMDFRSVGHYLYDRTRKRTLTAAAGSIPRDGHIFPYALITAGKGAQGESS
jgi:hypothetical protein